MPYLICNKCNVYYEIEDDFDLRELEKCENCGEKLKYYESMDEYYKEIDDTVIEEEKISNEDHISTSKEESDYNLTAISGFVIALLGLCVFIFAYMSPFIFLSQNIGNLNSTSSFNTILSTFTQILLIYILSFVLMAVGVIIYIFGKRKNHHLRKRSGGMKKPPNYLNHLPEGYFILNKVKIPLKKVNFDHVVIGQTGIFLIKIKKLKGNFIINENEWYAEKGRSNRNMAGSHGRKLKTETIEFNRFLASRGLDISHLIISTIIAFSNDNFKIEKKPSFYEVLKLEEIDDFIVNSRRRMDETDVIEAMVLLEHYSKEIFKT